MSSQTYRRIIDPCLAASVSRSYYTALKLIGDTERAVALVVEGIESLNPQNVTGKTLRDAVVDVLVRAQMMPNIPANSQPPSAKGIDAVVRGREALGFGDLDQGSAT